MRNLILMGALIFTSVALGQNETTAPADEIVVTSDSIPKDEALIYEVVDEPAQFPGGRDELISFLMSTINVPGPPSGKRKYVGKSYVKFVVSKEGSLSDIRIQKGALDCPKCDEAALRAVYMMPNWNPGLIDGKPVNSYYTLPIVFNIR